MLSLSNDGNAFSRGAYERMSFIRAFESRALDLSGGPQPLIAGSIHLCAGQEAIPVGACAALGTADKILSTYRGHGWALAAGLDPVRVMAELCHREAGINGGRSGSALFYTPEEKFFGENSIVGAGAPIANGVAMALRHAEAGGVAVVSFGDGAMNQGAVHEAMVFAVARKLPVVFICENNGWSEMTPISRIVPIERLSKRGSGYGMPAATVDGADPDAVRTSVQMSVEAARDAKGPSLLEFKTARLWGHYQKDIEHYRSKSDRADAMKRDPILLLGQRLIQEGICDQSDLDAMNKAAIEAVDNVVAQVSAMPEPAAGSALSHVYARPAKKASVPPMPTGGEEMTYQKAINKALSEALTARPEVVIFGEDVGHAGGIFGCTRDLQANFGEGRVFDVPISEAAILGAAVGAAAGGLRPVVEIMWADFVFVALDQLVNQAANSAYLTRGQAELPMVVRMQQGATPGSCAQHSQCIEAVLAHFPGLRVGLPATPQDAYAMLRAAIEEPDPVVIIEARSLYQTKGLVDTSSPIEAVGGHRVLRQGKDCTILSYGTMLAKALAAAEVLSGEGIEVTVVDLRWLNPIDWASLIEIVSKTNGRAVVAHEANLTGGFGAEIASRLWEGGAHSIRRVATPDSRIPASPRLQRELIPDSEHIVLAAKEVLKRGKK